MFLHNSFRIASRSFKPSTTSLFRQTGSRLFSSSCKQFYTQNTASKLGLLIGASSAIALTAHSKILNEAANLGTINVNPKLDVKQLDPRTTANQPVRSRFNGQLQYRQLCYGSLLGLVGGVVIGKLSTVLVFITLSVVLSLQFLQTRGIIKVPWTSIVKVGADRVDITKLVLEDPSFKVSFALTFLMAAFNI